MLTVGGTLRAWQRLHDRHETEEKNFTLLISSPQGIETSLVKEPWDIFTLYACRTGYARDRRIGPGLAPNGIRGAVRTVPDDLITRRVGSILY